MWIDFGIYDCFICVCLWLWFWFWFWCGILLVWFVLWWWCCFGLGMLVYVDCCCFWLDWWLGFCGIVVVWIVVWCVEFFVYVLVLYGGLVFVLLDWLVCSLIWSCGCVDMVLDWLGIWGLLCWIVMWDCGGLLYVMWFCWSVWGEVLNNSGIFFGWFLVFFCLCCGVLKFWDLWWVCCRLLGLGGVWWLLMCFSWSVVNGLLVSCDFCYWRLLKFVVWYWYCFYVRMLCVLWFLLGL